jgi:hypothetical protein
LVWDNTEGYVESKKCWKRKKSYSDKPENLNLEEYKNHLFKKLKDTLEIAGFDIDDLKQQELSKHTSATIPISQEVGFCNRIEFTREKK